MRDGFSAAISTTAATSSARVRTAGRQVGKVVTVAFVFLGEASSVRTPGAGDSLLARATAGNANTRSTPKQKADCNMCVSTADLSVVKRYTRLYKEASEHRLLADCAKLLFVCTNDRE